jgi:L-alanine-DL-glutamate epimerase-like enolase superfamily enzyme
MKCGGIGEALRMIAVARAHGMQVMLGCMIESSIAITAARTFCRWWTRPTWTAAC